MTYQWARDFTLQLIGQYSVAGTPVPVHYNNQADALVRIPKLLDDAQMQVATTVAPIRHMEPLTALRCDENGAWLVYTLPKDCWQMCSTGLIRYEGERFQRFHRYHLVGNQQFAVPKGLSGEVYVEYFRYPRLLGSAPRDADELDNIPAVQMALPYYVASCLVMQEDTFLFSTLHTEYQTRLAQLQNRPHTECGVVEDAYEP